MVTGLFKIGLVSVRPVPIYVFNCKPVTFTGPTPGVTTSGKRAVSVTLVPATKPEIGAFAILSILALTVLR